MNNIQKQLDDLASQIITQLHKLESAFFESYVISNNNDDYWEDEDGMPHYDYQRADDITFLYHGTKSLYYQICLFFELKNLPLYHKIFTEKFGEIIDNEELVRESRGPLYEDGDPSMIILDDFREFLMPFPEFKGDYFKKLEVNKLKLILENTNLILYWVKQNIKNETSIYTPVKQFVEIVYPSSRNAIKGKFIAKYATYQPDILIPEISSAVEYKYIKAGANPNVYLDQLKVDADNYVNDSLYKFFYAVVFFENKAQLNPQAFKQAVFEKNFPDNWIIIPV